MTITSSKTVLISISLIVVLVRTTKPPQQLLPSADFSQFLDVDTATHFGPGHSNILTLLAKLSEADGVHQTASVQRLLPSMQTSGYLYAQYYSSPNCSTGSGKISFVEGYGTGICLATVDIASGRQSGSIMQSCSSSGLTLKVQAYSSLNCEGVPSEATYSMDVCAKSNAIYGISVSVRCTNDKTALPLLDDAIVERSYVTPNDGCSGNPIGFKAFMKSPCRSNQFLGATEYFTCPDKGMYQLSNKFDSSCSNPPSLSNSTELSGSCSAANPAKKNSIPSTAELYGILESQNKDCSAKCAAEKTTCALTPQPLSQPTHQPSNWPVRDTPNIPSAHRAYQSTKEKPYTSLQSDTGAVPAQPLRTATTRSMPSSALRIASPHRPSQHSTQSHHKKVTAKPSTETSQPTSGLQPTSLPSWETQPSTYPTHEVTVQPSMGISQPSAYPTDVQTMQPNMHTDQPSNYPTDKTATVLPSTGSIPPSTLSGPTTQPQAVTSRVPSSMPSPAIDYTGSPTLVAPDCQETYTACMASCPVVASNPVLESYTQVSCFAFNDPTITLTPTRLPSIVLTQIRRPPTAQPTSRSVITLDIAQTISGVTLDVANSPSFRDAYKLSTISSLKGGVTIDNIEITSITSTSNRRKVLEDEVVISSRVTIANTNMGIFSRNLNDAITGGQFTAALVSNGFPDSSASALAVIVDITTAAPTSSPNPLSVSSKMDGLSRLSGGAAAGIAIGVFAMMVVFVAATICRYRIMRMRYDTATDAESASYYVGHHFQGALACKSDVYEHRHDPYEKPFGESDGNL